MKNKFIRWENGILYVVNQQKLPLKEDYLALKTLSSYYNAIRTLKVRGAPLIGVAAAYGVVSSVYKLNSLPLIRKTALLSIEYLKTARPTAVNIFNELSALESIIKSYSGNSSEQLLNVIQNFADELLKREEDRCRLIGLHGSKLIKNGMNILTHCNTGMLATTGIGTALGIIYTAFAKGLKFHVYIPETRPLLQGGRLTAYELKSAGIPHTLITDNMRGHLFSNEMIDITFVGADRIAMNGDTANKIGTFESALFSHIFKKPFYIAAPTSTIDRTINNGSQIRIEERPGNEITTIGGKQVSVSEKCYNPAFDITPSKYISGIITEKGISKPQVKCLKELFS